MKIITGHDYYDSALAHGADDRIIFVREKSRFITKDERLRIPIKVGISPIDMNFIKNNKLVRYASLHDRKITVSTYRLINVIYVIFCGKRYSGLFVEYDGYYLNGFSKIKKIFWTLDSINKWSNEIGYTIFKNSRYKSDTLDSLFGVEELKDEALNFLIENKITIITPYYNLEYPDSIARINGDNLKDYEFVKIMDPFTAFQEIEMWVGGILTSPGKPMIEITDKDRIAKHGFDKFSFRKEKQA